MSVTGHKGGGKQRTPVESPDSLVSISHARIVDLVSEGEIVGLVDGLESVYLNETPARSSGVDNFAGLQLQTRNGTQDQTYIAGFPQVESEITVGTELRVEAPYVRAVTNLDLDALRINFQVPRLSHQNQTNGDITGYRVEYAIDVAEGAGPFQLVKQAAFDGKTTGGYQRSERVDLPGRPAGGWRVRVRRITPHATTSNIADEVYVRAVTEIIDAKFRYPNSALVALSFDAQTFGGQVPRRAYHMRGRIIRVPSNYDPGTRTYTGVWNGTFKLAYSNNPAWVYMDLLLHPRFGMGDRININQLDKWGLYQIAQYCDQLVDDGRGGQEPRFTCNVYLQTRTDALRVLQDLASVFRGITYWGAGQAVVTADLPLDPVYTFTNERVIGGKFSYKGSRRRTRYSVALVTWNDPADMYRQKVEYVPDDESINRFGVREVQISAFGCTSQGQAQRAGRWALLTNKLETDTVTFAVGLDGMRARPGQVVRIADNHRAGKRVGGIVTTATASSITVNRVDPTVAVGHELTCVMPDGTSETRAISAVAGNVLTVAPAFSAAPPPYSPYAVESAELATTLWRVLTVSETAPLEYSITASRYEPGKHGAVDFGTVISTRPITSIPNSVQAAPTNVRVETDYRIDQYQAVTTMTVLWDAAEGATRYRVRWRRDNGEWVSAGETSGTEIDVRGIYAGTYQVAVQAINSLDIESPWAEAGPFPLQGKTDLPPTPVALQALSEIFAIRVRWGVPVGAEDTAYTELQYNTAASEIGASTLGQIAYPTLEYLHSGMAAGVRLWFRARLIDKTGNVGPWSPWFDGVSSTDASAILDYLTDQITETQLGEDLLAEIDKISGVGPGSVNDRLGDLDEALQSQINNLQAEIADITGASDYDPGEAYLEGALVKFDGSLYRAETDVPAGNPPPNPAYWQLVGDYTSIGEIVASHTLLLNQHESRIEETEEGLEALASQTIGVTAGSTSEHAGASDVHAGALTVMSVLSTAIAAQALRIDQVWSAFQDNAASVTEITTTLANEQMAQASQMTLLQADVGDAMAAVQIAADTVASLDGQLSAMYSIKAQVDVNGRIYSAGMGLGVENTPSGMQSQVLFLADRFAVMSAAGATPRSVFAVEGGQVFMNSAVIKQADIINLIVTGVLQSGNYIAGQQGVRINFVTGEFELNGNVPGQGRLNINNQLVRIYDSSNSLRVRLGIW